MVSTLAWFCEVFVLLIVHELTHDVNILNFSLYTIATI